MKFFYLSALTVSLCMFSFCRFGKNINYDEKQERFDPLCGDSVLWHIHLQDGFESDSILFNVGENIFPAIVATTGKNGCTPIQLTCYNKEDEAFIYLHNMPSFNLVQPFQQTRNDSVFISISVNGEGFLFKESLKYNKFFSLNYSETYKSFSCFIGKSCFGCE